MSETDAILRRLKELRDQYQSMFDAGLVPLSVDEVVGEALECLNRLAEIELVEPSA